MAGMQDINSDVIDVGDSDISDFTEGETDVSDGNSVWDEGQRNNRPLFHDFAGVFAN